MSAAINAFQTARTWSTQKIIIKTSVKHFQRRDNSNTREQKGTRNENIANVESRLYIVHDGMQIKVTERDKKKTV